MAAPKNHVPRKSKAETDARRARVIELVDQGASPTAIAAKEGVHVRTINQDIAVMRETHATLYAKKAMELFAKWEHMADQRRTQAWLVVLDKSAPHAARVNALRAMVLDDMQGLKRAQALGLFPRDPPKIEITQEIKQINIQAEILQLIKESPDIVETVAQKHADEVEDGNDQD